MIAIVSGLPRSGTSLMMQMLAAGGMTAVADQIRTPDVNNPRGYYEWEKIKQLPGNPALIAEAEGKLVKVVSPLLTHLPLGHQYRIVFMRRPLQQIVASQTEMIRRLGNGGPNASSPAIQNALQAHLRSVAAWLALRPHIALQWVDYPDLISNPVGPARQAAAFLERDLDVETMAAQADPALFRIRC